MLLLKKLHEKTSTLCFDGKKNRAVVKFPWQQSAVFPWEALGMVKCSVTSSSLNQATWGRWGEWAGAPGKKELVQSCSPLMWREQRQDWGSQAHCRGTPPNPASQGYLQLLQWPQPRKRGTERPKDELMWSCRPNLCEKKSACSPPKNSWRSPSACLIFQEETEGQRGEVTFGMLSKPSEPSFFIRLEPKKTGLSVPHLRFISAS